MFNKYILFVGPLIGVFYLTFVGAPMDFGLDLTKIQKKT